MRSFSYILISLLLVACSTGVELKPIHLGPMLHDNNSKVWMIDKVIIGGKNFAPVENVDKDVIIFYSKGTCLFQPMKTLGDYVGKKGEFSLYSGERTLSVFFKDERWDFKITTLQENRIVLSPIKGSDLRYQLVLVPFPEF